MSKITIGKIRFESTCAAYPEQYEAFCDGQHVGYLCIRGGKFRVYYGPNVNGKLLYEATVGNSRCTLFKSSYQREHHLKQAREFLYNALAQELIDKVVDQIEDGSLPHPGDGMLYKDDPRTKIRLGG